MKRFLTFVIFVAFCANSFSQSGISTNKTMMLNDGLGGTTNNALPPSDSNFFDVNFWHLTNALGNGGYSPTASATNIPAYFLTNFDTRSWTNTSGQVTVSNAGGNTAQITISGSSATGGTSQTLQSTPAGLVLSGQLQIGSSSSTFGSQSVRAGEFLGDLLDVGAGATNSVFTNGVVVATPKGTNAFGDGNWTNSGTVQFKGIPGGTGYFAALDASGNISAAVPGGGGGASGNISVTGVTNTSLTPNTVLGAGAGTNEVSIANPPTPFGFMAFNGTSNVWASPDDTISWREEFMSGATTLAAGTIDYGFGERNWGKTGTYNYGSLQEATGVTLYPNHPGQIEMNASPTTAGWIHMVENYPGQSGGAFEHTCSSMEYIEWDWLQYTVIPNSSNAFCALAGWGDANGGNYPANGCWWQIDNASTNVLECVCAKASVYVTNWSTTTTTAAGTWYKLSIQWLPNTNVVFMTNHVPVWTNTVTTSVAPAHDMWPFFGMGTATTNCVSTPLAIIDYCAWYQHLGTNTAWGVYGR